MKNLLFPALIAALFCYIQCTPKAGTQTSSTPQPPDQPTQYDTIGKPVMGEQQEEMPAEYTITNEGEMEPEVEPDPQPALPDSLLPYNPSHTFEHDLIHTRIEISFDWEKKRANGKTTLTLRPWFYATDKVTLDAKNFDIKSVTYDGKTEPLKYDYDNAKLTVQLGKTLTRNDQFKLTVTYTAKPDERTDFGGSAAITSDKGLYFINADGADPTKPRQIWTQGETESNSFWFPTIDKPNERCTQEMFITVENKYKTLSNGVLVSSKKNANGTRTDYWKMDKSHAPYLFMMAIGEYAVVKDKWRGIDVEYYVEPKYEADARAIYPYTPEMLEFFSKKLDYNYAWPKFSQVVVRDYVSGAMENTTAVIFGEFMQKTKRELLDDQGINEKVVAHEMFHHWFGDLVTTESWANLTLNEGFANYAEYLWLEHKHGRDEADYHLVEEQQGYIFSAAGGGHPLIHFAYNDREDMFDAHSYNKGGAVLHMLRQQVGDEAFFAALNRYLKRNEFTDVESHELRLAFEDVTGQDLNWFFNQWYLGAGHPILDITYGWDETAKQASVTIEQQQTGEQVAPIFNLPLAIDLYDANGKARRERVQLTKRKQVFTFPATVRPTVINTDAERVLLAVKEDHHTPEEWAMLFRYSPLFRDRWEAMEALQRDEAPVAQQMFNDALNDKFWAIRLRGMSRIDPKNTSLKPAIAKLAAGDPNVQVRATALALLGESADAQYRPVLEKSLDASQAYSVVGAALNGLNKIDPAAALAAAKPLEKEDHEAVVAILAELYAQNPDRANLAFYEQKMGSVDFNGAFTFFGFQQQYLVGLNDAALLEQGLAKWKAIALDAKTSQVRRFSATKVIADTRNFYREKGEAAKAEELQKMIEEIKSKETDETLKLYYDMF